MKKININGTVLTWLQINLQQGLIISESGYILACYVSYSNKLYYKKPLVKMAELEAIRDWCVDNTYLTVGVKLIQTDSFSIGGWNADTYTTELF